MPLLILSVWFSFLSFWWHCTVLYPASYIKHYHKIFHIFKITLFIYIYIISYYTSRVFSFFFSLAIGSIYFLLSSHPLCADTSSSWRRAKRTATASEITWKEQPSGCFISLPISNRCSCYLLKIKITGQQVHTIPLCLFSSTLEGHSSQQ